MSTEYFSFTFFGPAFGQKKAFWLCVYACFFCIRSQQHPGWAYDSYHWLLRDDQPPQFSHLLSSAVVTFCMKKQHFECQQKKTLFHFGVKFSPLKLLYFLRSKRRFVFFRSEISWLIGRFPNQELQSLQSSLIPFPKNRTNSIFSVQALMALKTTPPRATPSNTCRLASAPF